MHLNQEYCLAFDEWLTKPAGLNLVALEKQRLNSILSTQFGYYAVLLGENKFVSCLQPLNIKHQLLINPHTHSISAKDDIGIVCARQDKIPVGTELVDLVYIAHCLEFSGNPHEVLREAYRILRPDGRLIISMFNPLSMWALWRLAASLHSKSDWKANFIMLHRLKDWLALLGFDIMRINNFGFCMPLNSQKISWAEKYGQKLDLPFGAAYLVEASKRIIPVTPIRPAWATERAVAVEDAAEPTV